MFLSWLSGSCRWEFNLMSCLNLMKMLHRSSEGTMTEFYWWLANTPMCLCRVSTFSFKLSIPNVWHVIPIHTPVNIAFVILRCATVITVDIKVFVKMINLVSKSYKASCCSPSWTTGRLRKWTSSKILSHCSSFWSCNIWMLCFHFGMFCKFE